jgi:hypothetical protein
MKKYSFAFFFLAIIMFSACRKDLEKPSWDTQILTPLVNSSLSINNLLPDSILQVNADSSLKIVFENDIYKLDIDTLFKIPDTTLKTSYNLPIVSYVFNPGQVVVNSVNNETRYQIADAELRTVTVKSGFVSYTIKSKIHEVTNFSYTIPCAKLGGVPFSININVPAAVGSTPGVYSQVFDLSGYVIDLTGVAHNRVNTIYTSMIAKVSPDAAGPVTIDNTDSLIIENKFYDLIPYYAKGYFGNNTFNIGPGTTDFNLFSRITDGTIQLEDVNFNLKLENFIGLDARVYINNLSSINTRTGNTINLVNSLIGAPININRAADAGGGVVYSTYASYPLTVSNSNIKPMIENLPDKFGYQLQIITNPLGNISGSSDFVYYDKLLNAKLNMEIPLSLVATNLTLVDTLNFSIGNNENKNIHSGTLTLYANNGFPLDASAQMYLLNEQNVITDSIFGYANTIDEAPVNAAYRAVGKKLTKLVVPLNEQKVNKLYATKKIIIKVKFNTSAQPNYIKIYSDYKIDIKLVGDFNYTVQLQ